MMSCNKYSVNKIYGKDHDKTEQTVLTTLRYFHPGNLYADSVQGGWGCAGALIPLMGDLIWPSFSGGKLC